MIVGETAKVLNLYLEPMRIKSVLVIFRLSLFALNRSDPTDSDISVILLDSLQQRYFSHVYVNFATHREFFNYIILFKWVNSIFGCNKYDISIVLDFKTTHMPRCSKQP